MQVLPSGAEAKLGFDIIRKHLRGLAQTSLGQACIASLKPLGDVTVIRGEFARVEEIRAGLRRSEQVPLSGIRDLWGVLKKAAPAAAMLTPMELADVRSTCRCVRRLKKHFAGKGYVRINRIAARMDRLGSLEDHLDGILDSSGAVRDEASDELRRLRRRIPIRREALRIRLQRELAQARSRGYAAGGQPTLRGGRMVIPLRAETRNKVAGFVHGTSATGLTVYLEPQACLEMNNQIHLLEAAERREVERVLREATTRVRASSNALEINLRAVGRIDTVHAKAVLAEKMDAVVPKLNVDGIIDLRAARNPALLLCQNREVVPLNLELGRDHVTLVITGPNAGGKTVAMKTVGLVVMMAAYGIPVPVLASSSLCLFDILTVEIGDEQSIEHDLSTFSSRVLGLRRMAELANPHTLILIDEIGTGTDPEEGAALAQAMLEALTRAGARTIATTHHGMLKAYAQEGSKVVNGSMEFDVRSLRPTFRFRQGIPGSSYAFRIADCMELPHEIIARARELRGRESARLESLMQLFEERNQDLGRQLESLPEPQHTAAVQRPKTKETKRAAEDAVENMNIGDRVVLEGSSTVGEVLEINRGEAVVQFGLMRVRARTARLTLIRGPDVSPPSQRTNYSTDARLSTDIRGSRVNEGELCT